jgi:manganese-dependent inorganic pyrophosphatase
MKHIIGHKNPDTDTVCSAIAYEHFLNSQNVNAKAFALGPVNNETAFVLDYFGVDEPEHITE